MSGNQLGQSTSPYLLQHADNPVHWRIWGPEALAEAKALNRPILLSIGYAACHWCHVMAHESFENPATAAVMNDLFIPIKVDREERPDIDAIYMNALHLLGVPGGWPLTMFLTPAGEPFWGGTYYPPTARHGQPAFSDVLKAVHNAFAQQGDIVEKNRTAILDALRAMGRGAGRAALPADFPERVAAQLVTQMDPVHGGLAGAPKFLQTGLLELLWRIAQRRGDATMTETVHRALVHMSQGGIYDHLGGGFARYSVDAEWLVPHFEKMLYDNAALTELLSLVWAESPHPLYQARVEETVGFVLRELRTEEGAFAASLDADSEGEEGRFYVWTAHEIANVLGADAMRFGAAYGVREDGNWEEGKNILNRLEHLELGTPDDEAKLAWDRAKLFAARAGRVRPGFDDKVLADWNGLMVSAMTRAGIIFTRTDWIEEAEKAFAAVLRLMSFEQDGMLRLHQSYRAGKAQHAGVADSYANLARAALLLAEAGRGPAYVDLARRLAASLDRYFWDETAGGYFYTAADAEALIVRSRFAYDQPLPSANGVMIEVLTRLYHATGDDDCRARAQALIEAFSAEAARSPLGHATYLNGASFVENAWQIVIEGSAEDPATTALYQAAMRLPRAEKIVKLINGRDALPKGHPAATAQRAGGRATAYICQGTRCSLPVHDPGALAALTL